MDHYHLWFDLAPGVSDVEFADTLAVYLGHLKADGRLHDWHLARRKLALGHPALREFHVDMVFEDLAQLDRAFSLAAARAGQVEGLHQAVNSKVTGLMAALYRDFPDEVRVLGEEKF